VSKGLNKGHTTVKRHASERRRIVLTTLARFAKFDTNEAIMILEAEKLRAIVRQDINQYETEQVVASLLERETAAKVQRTPSPLSRLARSFTWPPIVTDLNYYQWPGWSFVTARLREWTKEGLLEVDQSDKPYLYKWVGE
jgi:hypothetical protein